MSAARHLSPRFKITADVPRCDFESISQRASATHHGDAEPLLYPL
jgi:hypothetical protein